MTDTEAAYNLALDYLYSFVDYSLKRASELARADFKLDRMRALMAALGNPETKYPIIHVAGTKGKGSVCALAASALQAAGYKTGLYTSPHLMDFAERIQINGEPLAHADFVDLVEQVKPEVARIERLTTFEITTALGLLAFARVGCTAAVVEVGLGGRLDATNVVAPVVSVITSLSYDHMAVLGNTLTAIAGEKAGIIKPGVPVVSAPQPEEALEVILRVVERCDSELTLVGRDVQFRPLSRTLDGQSFRITDQNGSRDFIIPLLGSHQLTNAATAYGALAASELDVPNVAMGEGFSRAKWPGRFEILRREPPFIIDSAHNRESALRLYEALRDYFPERRVVMVFCALEDKDIPGILAELAPCLERVVATRADHPRAASAEWIAERVSEAGIPVETAEPAAQALRRAFEIAGDRSLVLAAGSVAFAGEIRQAWLDMQQASR